MLLRAYLFVFAVVALLLQGCVAVQSFPTVARSGDTITLAVGSPDGMTKANTSAQFSSPALTNPVNLPIRSIIKLRPDNTSFVGAFDDVFTGTISNKSSHSAWLSMMVIDLPLGLPVGAATINVSTTSQYHTGANVNAIPIGVEILPGSGTPNKFMYDPMGNGAVDGVLTDLEALQQVVVRPPLTSTTGTVYFAAAEIKVTAPSWIKSTGQAVPGNDIKVMADDVSIQNSTNQMQMFWTRSGDEYTVNFVNNGGASPFQTRFSIVLYPNPDYEFVPGSVPAVTSVTYYDTNGNVKTGMPSASAYTATIE